MKYTSVYHFKMFWSILILKIQTFEFFVCNQEINVYSLLIVSWYLHTRGFLVHDVIPGRLFLEHKHWSHVACQETLTLKMAKLMVSTEYFYKISTKWLILIKTPDTILPKTAQKLLLTTSVNVYILSSDNLYPIIP